MGSSGLMGLHCRFLRVGSGRPPRTTGGGSGSLRKGRLRYEDMPKDIATQMATYFGLGSVRTGLRLATDNKGELYRPFLVGSNGTEGGQRMRFESCPNCAEPPLRM